MIEIAKIYKHKSGKQVFTQAHIKIKINGRWAGGVLYSEGVDIYARATEDFNESFTKI